MSKQVFRLLIQADWIETNDESGLVEASGRDVVRVVHRDQWYEAIAQLIREIEYGDQSQFCTREANRGPEAEDRESRSEPRQVEASEAARRFGYEGQTG